MTESSTPPPDLRSFRLLITAGLMASLGSQMQSLIVGWQIYEIKHDPLYLGLIGLTEAIPALSLALFAGHIVDRRNPLDVYKNVVRLGLLSALMLLVVSSSLVQVSVGVHVIILYAASFIAGIARGFNMPARSSLIPQMVGKGYIHRSSAWNTSASHIASVGGPALAGLIYAVSGPLLTYLTNTILLLVGIVFAAMIRFTPQRHAVKTDQGVFKSIGEGLHYVFHHQLLLSAIALDMFAVFFGGAVALLPIYASDILHVGPSGLGILRSAPAVGALIASGFLIKYPVKKHGGRILLGVVVGFGLSTIGFGLSRNFLLSLGLLALGGAFDSVSMVIRFAIVQIFSPSAMRGRIGSVNSIFIGTSNELGEFESGLAAKLMGTVPSVVFGGCMTIITVVMTAALAPQLRAMDLSEPPAPLSS